MSGLEAATRYAIYFVPARDSALHRFGASILGRDAYVGSHVTFPRDAPADWSGLTAEPRLYGFHATLKAPFRLAPGGTLGDLEALLVEVAARHAAFDPGTFEVRAIGRFAALVPLDPPSALRDLADDCVRSFEPFRAPLNPAEREKRLTAPLSAVERQYLDVWGYPYVFERFRFHMTLTGPLDPARIAALRDWLQTRWLAACGGTPLTVDRIALCVQAAERGLFRVHRTASLFSA